MKLYQVDAFSDTKFSGNPAWVMLVDTFPEESFMQNLAMEMNLSETAYVKNISPNTYEIRYFTPSSEVDLCGHATLSSAHILYSEGIVSQDAEIVFLAKWWKLNITLEKGSYNMKFPLREAFIDDDVENAQTITWVQNIEQMWNTNARWKILLIDSQKELQQLVPNFSRMKGTDFGKTAVMCKGDEEYDYYMRCFVADWDINEDPVTGSIECIIAPIWAEKLWKTTLKSFQLSKRGWEKRVEVHEDYIILSWNAITVFEIQLV